MIYVRAEPNAAMEPYEGPKPFRAIVISEMDVDPAWQAEASRWLVDSGCLYMLAWGNECSSWDVAVDMANIEAFAFGDIPEDRFVMTTWHANESLSDVFEFAKLAAQSSAPGIEIAETMLFHVSTVDRREEYSRLFGAA